MRPEEALQILSPRGHAVQTHGPEPLVVQDGDLSVPALDANQLLAEAAIEVAKAEH